MIGLLAGAAAGGVANAVWPNAAALDWTIRFIAHPAGQIFLNLLSMLVLPLIFSSLALGVAKMGNGRRLGSIGARTVGFFLALSVVAAALGLLLVELVKPGEMLDPATRNALMQSFAREAETQRAVAAHPLGIDLITGIVPKNPVDAAARGDFLGWIFFTLFFGLALSRLPTTVAGPLLRGLEALDQVVGVMVRFVMEFAPYGVAGLMLETTGRFGFAVLRSLGGYVTVVLLGVFILLFGVLAAVVRITGGMSPVLFFRRSWPAIVTALATASSNATLPTTLRAAEEGLGVPREIAGFVIPLGTTLNKTGTAFFGVVVIVFLAQVYGIPLDSRALTLVCVMSVLTSVAAGGIPFGVIPLLIGVLNMLSIPGEGIALILGVDQLMGMVRTVPNVVDDLVTALYVARRERVLTPESVPQVRRVEA